MDMQISEMTMEDYDEVFALWQQCEGVGLGPSDARPGIARYLGRNPGTCFVARDGGRVVGAVLCGNEGRRGYLNHLAVAASHRRRGVGTALVRRCTQALKQLGIPRCNLFVFARNEQALTFWRKLGWQGWDEAGVKAMRFDIP